GHPGDQLWARRGARRAAARGRSRHQRAFGAAATAGAPRHDRLEDGYAALPDTAPLVLSPRPDRGLWDAAKPDRVRDDRLLRLWPALLRGVPAGPFHARILLADPDALLGCAVGQPARRAAMDADQRLGRPSRRARH